MSGWTSTPAGQHLAGRRSSGTRPELRLRHALHAAGLRFRLNRSLAKGCNPDLVLPRFRIAIWVDGCFWHGHDTHKGLPKTGPNAALWVKKLAENRARDARAVAAARELGWLPLRIWECEVNDELESVVNRVLEATRAQSR